MTKSGILHIAKDEKFIRGAHYLFEQAFPSENTFVIVKPPADPPIRFLSKQLKEEAYYEILSQEAVEKLVKQIANFSVVVLHGLNSFNAQVYNSSSHKDRFMVIIHGAEIHNSELLENELMGPKTKSLHESLQRDSILDRIKNLLRSIKYRNHEYPDEPDLGSTLYNMRVFGSLPELSLQHYIDQKLYNPFVQKVPFTYYPLECTVQDESLQAKGRNILLGNSASATNNHLEIFDLLKSVNLSGRNMYTPLSYGCSKYAKAIIAEGNKLFDEQFIPLTSFLPLDEYNKVISRCGFVIMNHYRPQAMGNLIASLYMGAKVFLNDTESYRYFKQLGCKVFLIQEELYTDHAFELLSNEQVAQNRRILKKIIGIEPLVEGLQHAFEEVFSYGINEKVLL